MRKKTMRSKMKNVSDDEPTDAAESDDDISLASLVEANNQASSRDQGQANNQPAQPVFRWKKRDTINRDHSFLEELSEPPYDTSAILFEVSYNRIVRCCSRIE